MANNLRMPEESLEIYHARLRQEQQDTNAKLQGRLIWDSAEGAYVRPIDETPAKPDVQQTEYAETSGRPAAGAISIKNSASYGGPWKE